MNWNYFKKEESQKTLLVVCSYPEDDGFRSNDERFKSSRILIKSSGVSLWVSFYRQDRCSLSSTIQICTTDERGVCISAEWFIHSPQTSSNILYRGQALSPFYDTLFWGVNLTLAGLDQGFRWDWLDELTFRWVE